MMRSNFITLRDIGINHVQHNIVRPSWRIKLPVHANKQQTEFQLVWKLYYCYQLSRQLKCDRHNHTHWIEDLQF